MGKRRSLEFGDGHRRPMSRPFKRIAVAHVRRQLRPVVARSFSATFAHHNSTNGRCDPSQATIGRRAGVVRETVNRHHAELRRLGFLDWTGRCALFDEETDMRDLFGQRMIQRVVRQRTNQYFPGARLLRFLQGITLTGQKIYYPSVVEPQKSVDNPEIDPASPLGKALARLGATIAASEPRPKPPD